MICMKNQKMRGQAFIVFKDLQTSTAAMRKEDGRVFAGRAMKIVYATGKSYATIQNESGKEALYQYRMGIIKDPEGHKKLTVSGAAKALQEESKKREREENGGAAATAEDADEDGDDEEATDKASAAKKARTNGQAEQEDDDDNEVEMEVESDDE